MTSNDIAERAMTMAGEPADDDALADVFGSDREDRGGKEPAPAAQPTDDLGQPRDDHGRFAAKSHGEQPQDQQPPEQQQQAAPEPTEPPVDPNANRQVPLSELKSERAKRQEEARLRAEAEARARVYEQQLQQFMQQQRQSPPPQQQQPEPVPDPLTDPDGYQAYVNQQFQQQLLNERCNISELLARRHYGPQVVDEAVQAAAQAGVVAQFIRQPDPYGAIVEWHKREKALAKFGDDPEAYEKQLEQQIREKVLAELKAGGTQGQPQPRFPGTLANATATGEQGAVLTEEAMMQDVFGSERRNRRK